MTLTANCTNRNLLNGKQFKFWIPLAPITSVFVQDVGVPGLNLGDVYHPTPQFDLSLMGEKITYDTIDVSFAVQESFQNWKEIHDWMMRIADPHRLSKAGGMRSDKQEDLRCDAVLSVLDSNGQVVRNITFTRVFPILLSPVQFSTMMDDPVTCSLTLKFDVMEFDTYQDEAAQSDD